MITLGLALLPFQLLALLGLIPLIALISALIEQVQSGRFRRLAAERTGESICTFARAFDCRAIDTWIIRAVFEELRPYCTYGEHTLPLRPTDSLEDLLWIDPEDIEDIAQAVAFRAGRSLEGAEGNPFYRKDWTASDLVMFFAHQPLRRPE